MIPFAKSTHCKNWLFTSTSLLERKKECNAKAFAEVISHIDSQVAKKLAAQESSQPPSGGATTAASVEERRQKAIVARTLSIEEEDLIKKYYATKIREFGQFDIPDKALGTATIYFRRFFLSQAITHHDPKHLMLASIYLAAKVEEVVLPIEHIATPAQAKKEDVLAMEIPLLEGLQFDLIVHLPYNPLNGFLIDLKASATPPPDPDKLMKQATNYIKDLLTTDAPFLYPPAQLALAALHKAGEEANYRLDEYIHTRFHNNSGFEQLRTNIEAIWRHIGESTRLDLSQVKKVDRKLKKCVKPEFIPGTEAYAQRRKRDQDKISAKMKKELEREAGPQIDPDAFLRATDEAGSSFEIKSNTTRQLFKSGPTSDVNEQPMLKKRRIEDGKP